MDIYESMIKKCSMVNFVVDSSGTVVDTNMYTMMQLDTFDITGRDFYSFFDDTSANVIRSAVMSGNSGYISANLISSNGTPRQALIVINRVGSYIAVFGILKKSADRSRAYHPAESSGSMDNKSSAAAAAGNENSRMWQIDNIDTLTGLYNRNFFNSIYEGQYLRAVESSWNLGIMMVCIDNLNEIRKNYGSGKRDRLLVGLSQIILGSIRSTDYAFRYEDEYIMILLNNPRDRGLAIISERIRDSANDKLGITLSIGCAESRCLEPDKRDEVVKEATGAMELSIKQGGNSINMLQCV